MTTTNNTSSPSIQAIDKQSVHQICSGQVVLDLSTAVKELIENGLDASANNIEIKLREHGQQLIKVSDNGTGIEEKDFESIALKHYTSKIKEFHDLTFVDTFGFRGEALSSLSAVSDLCLSTKHKSADVGCKIDFDHNGKIISRSQIAKEQGTTVTVTNLFYTLPVRYKEFSRNYKKDFTKLINVLYSYSLINSSCRFKCTNFVNKNRNIILSTNGKSNTLDIITSLFGPKQTKNLIAIVQDNINETVSEEYNLTQFKAIDNIFTLTGYISNVLHGCGRSSPDRQFLFINKRPCDFSKLSRVINEAYHQFNRHQYPFVMLDISLNKEFVDVNVTPDKRQIMIHQEKVLFALVKSSLKSMFEVLATQFEEGNNENQTMNVFSPLSKIGNCTENLSVNDSYETNIITRNNTPNLKLQTDSIPKDIVSPLERFRSKYSAETKEKTVTKQPKIQDFLIKSPALKRRKVEISPNKDNVDSQIKINLRDYKSSNNQVSENLNSAKLKQNTSVAAEDITLAENSFSENLLSDKNTLEMNDIDSTQDEGSFYSEHHQAEASNILSKSPLKVLGESVSYCEERVNINISPENNKHLPNPKINNNNKKYVSYDNDSIIHKKVKVHFDFENVKKSFEKYHMKTNSEKAMDTLAFYAKISPTDNKSAETELSKHVSKETFLKMKILGQFNLGFIIAKYNSELFIIDQHASDEKYNFETLQRKHCLKGQKLIKPLLLELTNVNESVLIDNLDIFKKNGFDFEISEQKDNVERQNRIKLLTIPTSKNWSFSIDDVEELIFMLSDSPGTMCRPSRVRSMFASRACRKSVMVGTALNKRQMKELVTHMSEIEHPWNCPHGRPTMRHLINLKRLASS